MADELNVTTGDTVTVRFTGDSRYYTMKVSRILRGVSGAYVGRGFWRSLGRPYVPTTAYAAAADRTALAAELDRYDFVDGWQTRETVTDAAGRAALQRFSGGVYPDRIRRKPGLRGDL